MTSILQPGIIQVRIPELPLALLPITGDELIQIVQQGRSRKAKITTISATPWRSVTSNETLKIGDFIAVDTSAGPITLTLPGDPIQGEKVELADARGFLSTNPLTINGNGETIEGLPEDLVVDMNRVRIILSFQIGTWRVLV